ncbi:hypothetical protein IV417_08310 [Alphaproteobacteria bacterium KMM 3653]|uniref:Uncharacterized protein n=1 Tax=Harenicola maris TaxID=2841044 RepID=A0AAP2G7L1_9RHOB|nr:hypothetical protein [Harenicola maris]
MLRTLSLSALLAAAMSLPAAASTTPVDFPALTFPSGPSGGQDTTIATSNCTATGACSASLPSE